MLMTLGKYPQTSPIAQLNRQYGLSQVGATARLFVTPHAERVLSSGTRGLLSEVADCNERLRGGCMTEVWMTQLDECVRGQDPQLAAALQVGSIALTTWTCYRAFKTGRPLLKRFFCSFDVLLGVLETLSWLVPQFNYLADRLTIVHVCCSLGEKAYDRAFPASSVEGKLVIAALNSQPGIIQRANLRA